MEERGEMRYFVGRIAGRMRNIFGEIQPALREGQKNAPEKGACLYGFTREVTEMFRVHKLDARISQTRCSDITN